MMGWLRGFFTVIVAVLLFFSVFSLSLFGIVSTSLTYDNVYKESSVIFGDILSNVNVSLVIEKNYPMIVSFCENNSEYVFSEGGYVFDISCESVMQGTEAILEDGIKSVISKIYYDDYSIDASNYIDEPQNAPLFLISEQAHDSASRIFYYSILASLILLAALFFLVENKSNTFLIPGIYFVLNSLMFFKINNVSSLFSDGIVFKFLGIFFSTSFSVSVKLLIIGILLIVIAIVFKVFKVGFWISSVMEKFQKRSKPEMKIKKR